MKKDCNNCKYWSNNIFEAPCTKCLMSRRGEETPKCWKFGVNFFKKIATKRNLKKGKVSKCI